MEINNPFLLNQFNSRLNMKTEFNKNNRQNQKLNIYQNIKNIWNNEKIGYNPKLLKLKGKNAKLLLNNNATKNLKIKISNNLDNTKYINSDKKSLFEDNYFIDKFKQKKIKYSLPTKKENSNSNHNFYLNNIFLGFDSSQTDIYKPFLVNTQKFRDSDISKIPYVEDKNIYNKLNLYLENYIGNINDKSIEEFLKHQKKILLYNSTVNTPKLIKKNIYKEENDDDDDSLSKMIHIEPIKTNININGKSLESNELYFNKIQKNKLNISYTQDNILKLEKSNKISLPTLSINPYYPNTQKHKISSEVLNSIEENNSPLLTDRKTPEAQKNKKFNFRKNLEILSSEKKTLNTQKHILNSSSSHSKEKHKKYKIDYNLKLKTVISDIPPSDYYTSDFYYYIIFPQNCGWLIKKCLNHRLKWKECHSNLTNFFNFKWKDVVSKRDFLDFGSKSTRTQIINHFEYHSCLSNKFNMFYNLSKFCEMNNNDVFKYVPFTICFDCLNFDEFNIYKDNFKEIFYNINNYIFNNNAINGQIYNRKKIPYRELFPLDKQKYGFKFYCEIPKSHYAGKNLWIVKAPNLNRGRCIKVFDNFNEIIKFLNEMRKGNVNQYENIKEKGSKNDDIKEIIEEKEENEITGNKEKDDKNTLINNINSKDKGDYQSNIIILQKYIEKPFLYNGRKFDIRIWVLITHKMDIYIFKEGHLKASSVNYSIDNNNSFIHLTNYSLQKYNKNFSKYELGNEISFESFQQFLNTLGEKSFNFRETIIPKFKEIIELSAKATKSIINRSKKNYCFEIFGYDFMMDEDKNVYLIEINTNPGLEISSKVIEILVPRMIDDALRLTIDDLFETKYNEEWTDEKGEYKSNYHVDGYEDKENMWEFICNMNKFNDKYICEDYYGFGYLKNKKKKHNQKNKH